MNHAGMIVGHAGVMVLVNHIVFGELRPSIGLSGLQGPSWTKEKQEKERSELRDLVRSNDLDVPLVGAVSIEKLWCCPGFSL